VTGPGAASEIYDYLFGDVTIDQWVGKAASIEREPWRSFARSAEAMQENRRNDAIGLWQEVAGSAKYESRQILQAWHFLRGAGVAPPPEVADQVLGVVFERPVNTGRDTLAAYGDGSARYLNYSGKIIVWEDRAVAAVQAAIHDWLAVGQDVVGVVGAWDQPKLPALPVGHARLVMLTPGGHHFGQGPVEPLVVDPVARGFVAAATALMQLLVTKAQ
jgi:hypothetical protein